MQARRLPSQIRRELRSSIDRVFEKALAFNVADRYVKARDFGDAFYNALAEALKPAVPPESEATDGGNGVLSEIVPPADAPVREKRPANPPQLQNTTSRVVTAAGVIGLLALIGLAWYYAANRTAVGNLVEPKDPSSVRPNVENSVPKPVNETQMPAPRSVPQPPNSNIFQNSKQNLKGDLIRNFLGFTLYYPKDWTVKGPYESTGPNLRGKFLDISHSTPEGRLRNKCS